VVIVQDTGHWVVGWELRSGETGLLVPRVWSSRLDLVVLACEPEVNFDDVESGSETREDGTGINAEVTPGKALVWDDSDGEPIEDC
jgi:hypothetical protein